MILRVAFCLALVLVIALPAEAAQRSRLRGLNSVSAWHNVVPRPPRSIPRVGPRRSAAKSGPAAPARSRPPASAPASPPPAAVQNKPEAKPLGTDLPPVQILE